MFYIYAQYGALAAVIAAVILVGFGAAVVPAFRAMRDTWRKGKQKK